MLSRDSEESVEDDIEGLGVAPAQGTGEVAACKEEVKGAEEEGKGDLSPSQPGKDAQRLRDNVT